MYFEANSFLIFLTSALSLKNLVIGRLSINLLIALDILPSPEEIILKPLPSFSNPNFSYTPPTNLASFEKVSTVALMILGKISIIAIMAAKIAAALAIKMIKGLRAAPNRPICAIAPGLGAGPLAKPVFRFLVTFIVFPPGSGRAFVTFSAAKVAASVLKASVALPIFCTAKIAVQIPAMPNKTPITTF